MPNKNHVVLEGHLGEKPELKYAPSGAAVINFSMATNESWKDKNGDWQKITDWHRIVVWNKDAEFLAEEADKGTAVHIEGKLKTRSYDKDGKKQYITEVKSDHAYILGYAKNVQQESAPAASNSQEPPPPEDDLPF